jgi:hypothetical protein
METWIAIVSATAAGVAPVAAFLVARSSLINRRLPRWYLMPSGFEQWRWGRCYRWLGARWFKYWLPFSGDWIAHRMGWQPLRKGKRQAMLDQAFQDTVLYELIHLFILLPLLPVIVLPFRRGAWTAGLFVVAVNLVVNVYPMMVQRHNRARLLPRVSGKVRERWRITAAMLARHRPRAGQTIREAALR